MMNKLKKKLCIRMMNTNKEVSNLSLNAIEATDMENN